MLTQAKHLDIISIWYGCTKVPKNTKDYLKTVRVCVIFKEGECEMLIIPHPLNIYTRYLIKDISFNVIFYVKIYGMTKWINFILYYIIIYFRIFLSLRRIFLPSARIFQI